MRLKDPQLLRDKAYVNGEWVAADSGAAFDVTNPANGEVLARVPDMLEGETRRAIEAANAAWPAWAAKTAKERANVLRKWFDLIMANVEDLAVIMTSEQGKPLAESRGEVAYGASFIEWFAEEGKRIYGDVIPQTQAGRRIIVLKAAPS
jgi:succinate-semialdehyde dehydrogenase / glutarate-semialdehyde dehydrogenase